jgi:hypothetical protein
MSEQDPTVVDVRWTGLGTRVELSNGFVEVFDVPARHILENPNSTREQIIAARAVIDYWGRER